MLCKKVLEVFHGTVRYSTGCSPDRYYLSIYKFLKLAYVLTVANIKQLNFTSLAVGMICI